MKYLYTIFLAIFIIGVGFSQPIKVAVFDPAGSVPNDIKTIIREEISAPMVDNPAKFEVLERAMIDQIAKEQKFQLSGEVDNNQISELGKKLGADYVCVSSITKTGDQYYIAVKLVAVATALVKKQVNQMTKNGINDIYPTVQNIAQKLVTELGEQMNSSNNATTKNKIQNSPNIANNPPAITYDEFKMRIKEEKESMLQGNSYALASYKKYKSYKTAGWWLLGGGTGFIIIGGTMAGIGDEGIISGPMLAIGFASAITGTIFLLAKPYLKTTYNYYLKGGTKQSLSFNFTPIVQPRNYGVGMTMKF